MSTFTTSSYSELRKKIPSKISIVAVSKLQSIEKIKELYALGQRQFGENYLQEALKKIEALEDLKIQWHFVGRIQSNKVKQMVGQFSVLQSVDSMNLIEKINSQAQSQTIIQKIFLQANLAQEPSKGGFDLKNLNQSLAAYHEAKQAQSNRFSSVEICGLMTMPPLSDDPEYSRPYFRQLRQIRDQWVTRIPSLTELSMGTSSDYETASDEGATILRLGSILFGERTSHSPSPTPSPNKGDS